MFASAGYRLQGQSRLLSREITGFRPQVSRQQLQIRRSTTVTAMFDPQPVSWWDACAHGTFTILQFELRESGGGALLATARFWLHDTLSLRNQHGSTGLLSLDLNTAAIQTTSQPEDEVAVYLLSEALRQLADEGFDTVNTLLSDQHSQPWPQRLGFAEVDRGNIYVLELT